MRFSARLIVTMPFVLLMVPAPCRRRAQIRGQSEGGGPAISVASRLSTPSADTCGRKAARENPASSAQSGPDAQPSAQGADGANGAAIPRSSGSWDIRSGARCQPRTTTAWVTCMAEAPPWPTTSTGIRPRRGFRRLRRQQGDALHPAASGNITCQRGSAYTYWSALAFPIANMKCSRRSRKSWSAASPRAMSPSPDA